MVRCLYPLLCAYITFAPLQDLERNPEGLVPVEVKRIMFQLFRAVRAPLFSRANSARSVLAMHTPQLLWPS